MKQQTETLTDNGSVTFNLYNNRRDKTNNRNIAVEGTFDSGTVALTVIKKSGGAEHPVLDAAGAAIEYTTDGITNFIMPGGKWNEPVVLKATLTGSTTPSLEIILDDSI